MKTDPAFNDALEKIFQTPVPSFRLEGVKIWVPDQLFVN